MTDERFVLRPVPIPGDTSVEAIGPPAEVIPLIRTTRKQKEFCSHKRTQVDFCARVVVCAMCGADLDPISVLADLAHSGDHFVHLAAAKKRLQEDIERLEGAVRRLKSQVRYYREKEDGRSDSSE